MTIIKKLDHRIGEEVRDAEHYIKLAIEYQMEFPKAAAIWAQLSEEELEHATRQHDAVVEIIRKHREEHGDPPAAMMQTYEYLHEIHMEAVAHVKSLQAAYKESK